MVMLAIFGVINIGSSRADTEPSGSITHCSDS
jgi:hypothetical protein